jgi:hypothetical protein
MRFVCEDVEHSLHVKVRYIFTHLGIRENLVYHITICTRILLTSHRTAYKDSLQCLYIRICLCLKFVKCVSLDRLIM